METNTETNTETAVVETPNPNNDLNVWGNSPSIPTPAPEIVNTPEPVVAVVEPVVTQEAQKVDPVEPVVTEKVVEKIVEKQPEFKDSYSKELYEAILAGKDDELYSYLTNKKKNYEVMADVDVVKEHLKLVNPRWSDSDIELEIKSKYGTIPAKKDLSLIDPDLDPEAYDRAVSFNDSVDQKEMLLSREARDARLALEDNKKTIEFPKIEQQQQQVAPEMTQEEIDELNQKWVDHVGQEMPKLSDFKFKVGDEEITYKITEEDKASQTEYMKDFSGPKAAQDLGWIDADGNENVLKIAEDMLKLKHFDKILASSATQMKTLATKEVVADIKNIDLTPNATTPELTQTANDLGAKLWGVS